MKKSMVWLVVFLLGFAGLMAGCGVRTEKSEPERQQPAAGGKLNIGSAVEPDTWNPLLSELAAAHEVGRLVFSGLLLQNDKGEWLPDLAVEVPSAANGGISADGLTLTYKIHPNAKWHDGQRVTARDVRFTYDYVMRSRNRLAWREGYEKIRSVDTPDDATVVIRFIEPYALQFHLFACILPAHKANDLADTAKQNFNSLPVGSGPFILKEWRRGDALVFAANPAYHRGRPLPDTITFKIVTDRQIVLSQLKIGEVDIVNNIGFDQLDQVRSMTGVNVAITRSLILENLTFNLDLPLFADMRVRQAVAAAIDRMAIVEKTLKNAGFAAFTSVNPSSWAYAANLKPPFATPAQAKELLTASGWQQGSDGIWVRQGVRLGFTVVIPAGDKSRELAAQLLASQLREAGMDMKVQLVDRKLFFETILPGRRFEAALFAWVNTAEPDEYDLWHSRRIPSLLNRNTGKNFAGWRSREADALLEGARNVADVNTRRAAYLRLQELTLLENPVIPLYYRAEIAAAKRSVVNFKPNAFSGNLWNAWEWGIR